MQQRIDGATFIRENQSVAQVASIENAKPAQPAGFLLFRARVSCCFSLVKSFAAALVVAASFSAEAADIAKSVGEPNVQLILTDEQAACPQGSLRFYSLVFGKVLDEACYTLSDKDVHIRWPSGAEIRLPLSDFGIKNG